MLNMLKLMLIRLCYNHIAYFLDMIAEEAFTQLKRFCYTSQARLGSNLHNCNSI